MKSVTVQHKRTRMRIELYKALEALEHDPNAILRVDDVMLKWKELKAEYKSTNSPLIWNVK